MLDSLFSPIKIGSCELKNRLTTAPMDTSYADEVTGEVTERYAKYYAERAKGGFGLIITEYNAVEQKGKGSPGEVGIWSDSLIPGHRRMTDMIHNYGGKVFVQLHHGGAQALPSIIAGEETVSSSTIMGAGPFIWMQPWPMMPICRALTTDEVKEKEQLFIEAAVRAQKAGYDGVELHCTNGYLLQQFLSQWENKRTDEYGGNLFNRTRIVTNIIKGIKERCGKDFPVTTRISLDECVTGSNAIGDAKAMAMIFEAAGADAIDTGIGGGYSLPCGGPETQPTAPASVPHGFTARDVADLKKCLSIPVIAINRINDPFVADAMIKSGQTDLCGIGRGSLADPEFPNKAKEGRFEDIIHCTGCMQGCIGNVFAGQPICCLANPRTGREYELEVVPAKTKKKVFVAGGGCGGMEAAIIAAQRGHDVELFEKSGELGGQLVLAGIAPNKQEYETLAAWQKAQVGKAGIQVHTNTELTAKMVEEAHPDTVIIASGAVYGKPPIKGVDNKKVVLAPEILSGSILPGLKVVVIGGGHVGCETADHLCMHGRSVSVVEMLPAIGQGDMNFGLKMADFKLKGVALYAGTKVLEINDEGVVIENETGKQTLPCDTVVIATGTKSVNTLEAELEGKVETVTIGDAKQVRLALDAIREGYEAALKI